MSIAELLRERRKKACLSRARLARIAGLSEATIKFIETGRTRPSEATRRRLLEVRILALRPDELGLDSPVGALVASFIAALTFHRIHKRRNCRRIFRKEKHYGPKN